MKYCFKSGRGKKVIISGNETFEGLGYEMLKAYHIEPEHLYSFEFSNYDFHGASFNRAEGIAAM